MSPVRGWGGFNLLIERGIFPQDVTKHHDGQAGVCLILAVESPSLVSLSRTSCLVVEITLNQLTSVQFRLVHYKWHWSTLNSFPLIITRSSHIGHKTPPVSGIVCLLEPY